MLSNKTLVSNDLEVYVGDNIRQIMQKKNITNSQMADILNLSPSQIKKIKKGDSLLEIQYGIIICKKFHVNLERLYPVNPQLPLFKDEEDNTPVMMAEDAAQKLFILIDRINDTEEKKRLFVYVNRLFMREQLKHMK